MSARNKNFENLDICFLSINIAKICCVFFRSEICLGSSPGLDNIKAYQEMTGSYMTIDNIFVSAGTKIYATVKAYNNVGLHNVLTSDPIIVSPDPFIEVIDGKGETDSDYQTSLNIIQGNLQTFNISKEHKLLYKQRKRIVFSQKETARSIYKHRQKWSKKSVIFCEPYIQEVLTKLMKRRNQT